MRRSEKRVKMKFNGGFLRYLFWFGKVNLANVGIAEDVCMCT